MRWLIMDLHYLRFMAADAYWTVRGWPCKLTGHIPIDRHDGNGSTYRCCKRGCSI